MPVNERDIWRAARLLVDQHGRDAPAHAGQRAGELLASGDMEGQAVWKRILKAVEALTRTKCRRRNAMN